MKPLLLLFALSLAANAALFVARSHTAAVTSPPAAGQAVPPNASTESSASSASTSTTPLTADKSRHRLFWQRLGAGDASAVEELRAAGWPAAAIRSLVQAHIQSLFLDRMKALQPASSKDEYWSSRSMMGNLTPEAQKAARALWHEQTTLAKKLLGPDYAGLNDENSWRDQRFVNLTPAQAESVRAVEDDYSMLMQDIRGDYTGGPNLVLPEDREKLAFLEKERRADLARTLSPQELLEYELRASSTASTLRNDIDAFSPSEEEFRAIFSIHQKTADRLNYIEPRGMWTQQDQDARQALQAEIDSQLKQVLSDQRFAEYTRAKDYDYRRLYQLSKRLDLPAASINAAYEVKTDVEKRLRDLRPDPAAKDRESFNAARTALIEQAEQQLKDALGSRAYEAYAANNGYVTTLRRSYLSARPPAAPAKTAK